MTVSSTTTKVSYSGDGTTSAFAYSFKIFNDSDLVVIVRTDSTGAEVTKTINTDYLVSNAGESDGGTVTFKFDTGNSSDSNYDTTDRRPQSGETVLLKRVMTLTQNTDYTPNDSFPAAAHEEALDKLTFIQQQQQEEIDRSFKFAQTDTGTITIPTSTERASKYLGFDSSGDVIAVAGTADVSPISTFAATIVDDTSASAVRATIGLGDLATLNTVGSSQIDTNAVTASELNISGNGTSGQSVVSDGDGSFSYVSVPAFVSGMVMPYAGTSAPTGFLLCGGQAVSRTTYSDLFAVIGTTYGVGDGSSTFNVPDLQGRVVAGKDDMSGSSANRLTDAVTGGLNGDTLGDTGGTESHTLTSAQSGLRQHSHSATTTLTRVSGSGSSSGIEDDSSRNTVTNSSFVSTTISNSSALDASEAHNNVQPTIILNYIIKT
tara:strand:- start:1703 stop:3001 length:1299 start_codon:yes stop_codon:yes gene_type:complete